MKKSFRSKLPALIVLLLLILSAAIYILFFTTLPEKLGWREDKNVVASCVGYDMTLDEVRYVTLLYRAEFEARYGEDVWKDPEKTEAHRSELEETVTRELKNNYAVLATAKDHLSKEEIEDKSLGATVDAQIDELKAYYGDSFAEILKGQNLTESFLRFTLWVDALQTRLYEKLDSNQEIVGFADTASFYDWLRDGNCVYLQYVYLSNDPGEDPKENLALAERIREELLAGKDIAEYLGSAVNDDLSNVAPRFFVRELCEDDLWQTLKELMLPGQVSRVVQTEKGFYVFVAMEEPSGLLEGQADDLFSDFKTSRKSRLVESYRERIVIDWNERGKAIDFVTLN